MEGCEAIDGVRVFEGLRWLGDEAVEGCEVKSEGGFDGGYWLVTVAILSGFRRCFG